MLKRIELENFKSFQKTEIDFGLVTVLIGPNGTGKSSIWQPLMLLRQSIGESALQTSGPLINLGDFSDLLNKHASVNRKIGLLISFATTVDYHTIGILGDILFTYRADFTPIVESYEAKISTAEADKLFTRWSHDQKTVVDPEKWQVLSGGPIITTLHLGSSPNILRPFTIQSVDGDRLTTKAARDEASSLFSMLGNALKSMYYVPAVRGLELPYYPLLDNYLIDLTPVANAQLASTFAYGGHDLEEMVSRWCEDITGSPIGSKVIPGRRVGIESQAAPGGIPIICDGFGANQLVHLLLTLATTPKQSVIAIEEPEIHLHPKAQTKLCNTILQVAKSSQKQIVITTHSQHILYAFVNAVRDKHMSKDELAIYSFAEKGHPRRIEQDEHGDIYDWSRNFFDFP